MFDVDIEDGKPPLKLPYNLSENPYERARKFLEDNKLPLTYLDNVVQFIEQNTKGATLGDGSPDQGAAAGGADEERAKKVVPQGEYLSILGAKHEREFRPPLEKKGFHQLITLQQLSTRSSPSMQTWFPRAARTRR